MKIRVYPNWPSVAMALISHCVFGVVASFLVAMTLFGLEYLLLMMICGGLSGFVMYVVYHFRYPALLLTEDTITYHGSGYRLEAYWRDVEGIGPVRSLGLHPEGLRLRSGRFRVGWFPGLLYVVLIQVFFPEIRTTIPLGQLTVFRSWRQTQWGQEILARIPPTVLQDSLKGPGE